jgi:hypothetical protein
MNMLRIEELEERIAPDVVVPGFLSYLGTEVYQGGHPFGSATADVPVGAQPQPNL